MVSTSRQASMRAENGSGAGEPGPFPFLDALPVGIFIALPGRLPYYANREALRLLGRGLLTAKPGDELRAYQAYVVGTNDIYPDHRAPLVRALAGETAYADDMEIRRPDGSVMLLEVWGTPVVGPSGSVDYAIATFVDISERRRAEAALASRRALLDLAHDAAFLTDTDAQINYWNTGAEQIEIEGRVDVAIHLAVRGRNPRLRWKCVVINAAVLIPKDHEQDLLPQRRISHGLVYVCNQHVPEANVVIRVLIVGLLESKVEIAGLDEAVVGQASVSRVFRKLVKEPEPVLELVHAKPLEGEGLRNVVKKDLPGAAGVL